MSAPITGSAGSYATSQGGNSGSAGLHTGYVYGLIPTWLSTSLVRIFDGACRSDDNTEDIVIAPGSFVTVDIAATGANGRNIDSVEAANMWYAVYVIKNPTTGTVAGFLIKQTDLGTFTWPAGYTKKRRVGWIRNNNTSNLRAGKYTGAGISRKWSYDVERTEMLALSGGSAVVFTDINLAEWVPPNIASAYLPSVVVSGVYDPFGTSFVDFRPNGSSVNDPVNFSYQSTAAESFQIEMYTDTNRIIEYQCFNGSDSLDIYVVAFGDDLTV